jgi:hypothetical protein
MFWIFGIFLFYVKGLSQPRKVIVITEVITEHKRVGKGVLVFHLAAIIDDANF